MGFLACLLAFASRDEQEVAGYADAMETIFSSWQEIALTEKHIKQLHGDLLKYSGKDERHRGNYKTLPNNVEAFAPDGESLGIVLETVTPFDTPRLMGELVPWTGTALASGELHPLLIITVFVVVFLEIHPFQDGNGRLSRILTTLLLLRSGYGYVPYKLAGECDRAEQGRLLSGAAPNAGYHPRRRAGLAALGGVFPEGAPAAKAVS